MVGRVAPLVLVADSTALGVWTYLARVLLEEYTWQCSCSSVFCHGGKGSPSGALCRRSSSTVHRSIYYQTLLSVLCYHLDSLVCLFVVFMFHPVTQGNENQSIYMPPHSPNPSYTPGSGLTLEYSRTNSTNQITHCKVSKSHR